MRIIIKMKLVDLSRFQSALIKGFDQALNEGFQRRLREIGFCEGAAVQLMRSIPFGGPRVFRVCDAVFSIEPAIARQIEIEPLMP